MNKGERDNNKGAAQSKPESKPSGKPEIKCGICGKRHLTSGSKGSNTDSSVVAQGMQFRNDDVPNRGR